MLAGWASTDSTSFIDGCSVVKLDAEGQFLWEFQVRLTHGDCSLSISPALG